MEVSHQSIPSFFQPALSSDFSRFRYIDGVYVEGHVSDQSYVENFGIQWNAFRSLQIDSQNGLSFTRNRLLGCTGWHPKSLEGKLVLEIGSGAGRFTEVLLDLGAYVVSIEPSNAAFASAKNNRSDRLIIIRSLLKTAPLNPKSFDYVLCYGVVQHTPSPKQTYRQAISFVKSDGICSFDHYEKLYYPSPWSWPKYFWRPISTRINPSFLLKIIRFYIPFYLPIDSALKRIPKIGFYITGLIPVPCWNYIGCQEVDQSPQNLEEWAIMDTFDALGAKFDEPWTLRKLRRFAISLPVRSFHVGLGGNGLLLNTYGNTST